MDNREERRAGRHPGKMPGGIKLLECINELEAIFGRMTLSDRDRATTPFKGMTALAARMPFHDPAGRDPYVENMYLEEAARQAISDALTSGYMPVWTDYDGVFVELDHEKLFGSNKWDRTRSLRTGVYLALNASHGADGPVRQECDGATLWVRGEHWPRIRADLIAKRERTFGSALAHDWTQLLAGIAEEPVKAGPCWSLYEAVAWIGSGDAALVAEQHANYIAVSDPATAGARSWLRLQQSLASRAEMHGSGGTILTAEQARDKLRLACERGDVAATGIPADKGARRNVPASDFIGVELWPGRGGSLHRLIGGRGEAARWFELRFCKAEVEKLMLGTTRDVAPIKEVKGVSANRGPRQRRWDWNGLWAYLAVEADLDGFGDKSQADIERMVADWFAARNKGKTPATSHIRANVKRFFDAQEERNGSA